MDENPYKSPHSEGSLVSPRKQSLFLVVVWKIGFMLGSLLCGGNAVVYGYSAIVQHSLSDGAFALFCGFFALSNAYLGVCFIRWR
jgi:hypothetical protein